MGRDPEEFEGLPREQVLDVLRLHRVDVATIGVMTYLSREDLHIAVEFDARIHRRTLNALRRTFDIPIHHFFHPEMIPRD